MIKNIRITSDYSSSILYKLKYNKEGVMLDSNMQIKDSINHLSLEQHVNTSYFEDSEGLVEIYYNGNKNIFSKPVGYIKEYINELKLSKGLDIANIDYININIEQPYTIDEVLGSNHSLNSISEIDLLDAHPGEMHLSISIYFKNKESYTEKILISSEVKPGTTKFNLYKYYDYILENTYYNVAFEKKDNIYFDRLFTKALRKL